MRVVIGVSGKVGRWHLREYCQAEGRHVRLRDDAVAVDSVGVRIHDGNAKRSGALRERGHAGNRERSLQAAPSLVVHEEEHFVFPYRPPRRSAELVLNVNRLLSAGRLEISHCVQIGIAKKLPDRAVQPVAAAAHRGVDHSASYTAIFRAVVICNDREFLDGVWRDLNDLIRETLVGRTVGIVVEAVEDKVIVRAAHPTDVEGSLPFGKSIGEPHSRRQQRK